MKRDGTVAFVVDMNPPPRLEKNSSGMEVLFIPDAEGTSRHACKMTKC
jgi:hypothetical protein